MNFEALLKELCDLPGISGREDIVRERIISYLPDDVTWEVDALGNLLVKKEGEITPKHRLLFSAHMDEVGLMVTYIEEDGLLRFATVGGIDPHVIAGRQVKVGETMGVVGLKPIHLQKEEELKAPISMDQLFIDIGAATKEEAEKIVSIGDSVTFAGEFKRFGNHRIMSKAIDDRFGCAMILQLLHEETKYSFYASFLVQEEVGLRGAKPAAFTIDPEIAIVLESTAGSDYTDIAEHSKACRLDHGPVIPFMDKRSVYDRGLYQLAFEVAKEEGIPCQTKTAIAGGNDAAAIVSTGNGVRTLAISLPCRNLHSGRTVGDWEDVNRTRRLVTAFGRRLAELP